MNKITDVKLSEYIIGLLLLVICLLLIILVIIGVK